MVESLAMKRILGVEPKKRTRKDVMIEVDFIAIIKERNMALSDTINVALEKHLIRS